MTIVSRTVAYIYIFRMVYANVVEGRVYENQSHKNYFILLSLIGVDISCSFYEKHEIYILKIISCICIFCIIAFLIVNLIIKWRYNKM